MEKLPQHRSAAHRLIIPLACLSVAATACVLYTRLHASTETKPLAEPAAPAVVETPKPVTIVENTLFGRRVRVVSPEEAKAATATDSR